MENNHIIRVSHLSKTYKLYDKKSDRLKEALSLRGKKLHSLFYALKDISFDVERGETIGIIGTNGSGKSTLLKVLTGVTSATAGNVQVDGKVSALLELGAGFNPEYTGLENIILNGSMMGFSAEEMVFRKEEIIRFADIGEYINQPVKNYSSGMFARLAFAVAVSVEPEILIVDETLSVGDMRFQIKCMDRMKQMMDDGTTILYVSHDINSVRRFCKKCMWIKQGELQAFGETNRVCDLYSTYLNCMDAVSAGTMEIKENTDEPEKDDLPPFEDIKTGEIAKIIDFRIKREQNENQTIAYDEPLTITVIYDVYDTKIEAPVLGVALFSIDDRYICGLNTLLDEKPIPWQYGRNSYTLHYSLGLRALGGKYYFDTALRDKTATVNIDYKKCVREIEVSSGYVAEGIYVIPHEWGI